MINIIIGFINNLLNSFQNSLPDQNSGQKSCQLLVLSFYLLLYLLFMVNRAVSSTPLQVGSKNQVHQTRFHSWKFFVICQKPVCRLYI